MDENLKYILDELEKMEQEQLESGKLDTRVIDHDCKEEECESCLQALGIEE